MAWVLLNLFTEQVEEIHEQRHANKKNIEIRFALLLWTADDDLRCALQSGALARGRPGWHGDIRHFHDMTFVCGVAVVGYMGGTPPVRLVVGHPRRLVVSPGGWYFYPAPIYPYQIVCSSDHSGSAAPLVAQAAATTHRGITAIGHPAITLRY